MQCLSANISKICGVILFKVQSYHTIGINFEFIYFFPRSMLNRKKDIL